jgi:pimeloyl-ACP methyl ester carboxylesterase
MGAIIYTGEPMVHALISLNRKLPLLSIAILLLLGGCASTYDSLISEDNVPALAALKAEAAKFPDQVEFVDTQYPNLPTVRMALHITGNEEKANERVMVLVHGVLADHESWRFVRGVLAKDYRMLMVDLPGAGESERPAPDPVGAFAPVITADRVAQTLSHYLKKLPEAKITLVAHSFGGLLAIRLLSNPELRSRYESLIERIDRVILFAPADAENINPMPALQRLSTMSTCNVALLNMIGAGREILAKATRDGVPDPDMALREDADKRLAMISDPATLRVMQAGYRDTIVRIDGRSDWQKIEERTADYSNFKNIPCLIVWGSRDPTLPVSMGHKLAAQLPSAKLHIVPGQMHSIHIQKPILASHFIRSFDQSGTTDFLNEK